MNAKMFNRNYYKDYVITDTFGTDRSWSEIVGYKYHEGVDYSHSNYTTMQIYNIFSGLIDSKITDKYYGNILKVKSNPLFAGGVNDVFYTAYCHLAKFDIIGNSGFLAFGENIGVMGNTGNSNGIHLHLMCYQRDIPDGKITALLNDIIDKLNIEKKEINYNWQFGCLYINPLVMMDYFKLIQG